MTQSDTPRDTQRHIAFVGAGPASLYGAAKLASLGHHVTILNRDIKPGGLAEYGIYLNKHKMKGGLRTMFSRILASPNISYYGNVTIGQHEPITLKMLQDLGFDALVVAVGAQGTKTLGLPGEDAVGVFHAKDLVYHYNHLPPFSERDFAVGQDVCVVGLGNVSLDIAHWLIEERQVRSVTTVARRGPKERACTPKEMKLVSGALDLAQLEDEFTRLEQSFRALGQDPREEFKSLTRFVDTPLEIPSPTALRMRFLRSPVSIEQDAAGRVSGLVCEVTTMAPGATPEARPKVQRTGVMETLPCDTVVFAIGDRIETSIGLPIDPLSPHTFATVPTPWEGNPEAPRYMVWDPEAQEPMWGMFVVGWARQASDGLVGKARADAETGAREIHAYLQGEMSHAPPHHDRAPATLIARLEETLTGAGIRWVDLDGVAKIEEMETREQEAQGVAEFKFRSNQVMLEIAGHPVP